MQHQLSNSNASTTIGRVKSSPTGNLASARLARSAETEASRAMQFKQARNFSKVKPEARERIRLVETALRVAVEGCVPQASSGNRHGDRQLSTGTPSSGAKRFTKSRIVAVIGLALVLPTLGVAVWLGVTPLADMSQQSPIPSPVLTAPAFLETTAGESIFLPIALDGTDGVPAHSSIVITGVPQGSTLSNGRPFGDTGWKLERDEIGDLQLVVPNSASGQAKLTIQLIAPDATLVADAEILLRVATAPQGSLPINAEDTDDAPLVPANQELAHESPEGRPDPGVKEVKPLAAATEVKPSAAAREVKRPAAATEREEEPVQSEPRTVLSQHRVTAKRTAGTNEVKTSVFVNLRQAPSPSAKVIRVVAKGTKLPIVARKGRWVQVTDPANSAKGWIYMGNANPPGTRKPSAPAEPSEDTQPKPDSVDTQPKSDSVWPSFLR
jgi:Bacterial SH3 domain